MYLHGRLLTGSRRMSLLKKALRLAPKHFHILCCLGADHVEGDKFRDARRFLLQAIEARPKSAIPWNSLGWMEERRDDPEMAEKHYRKAIECEAEHAVSHLNQVFCSVQRFEHRRPELVLNIGLRQDIDAFHHRVEEVTAMCRNPGGFSIPLEIEWCLDVHPYIRNKPLLDQSAKHPGV